MNVQLDLLNPPAQSHSVTSKAAAKSIKPSAAKLRERVYDAIATSVFPVCDETISILTGLSGNTCRPRRIELERMGRIQAAGTTKTRSGRQAVTWTVTTPTETGV